MRKHGSTYLEIYHPSAIRIGIFPPTNETLMLLRLISSSEFYDRSDGGVERTLMVCTKGGKVDIGIEVETAKDYVGVNGINRRQRQEGGRENEEGR